MSANSQVVVGGNCEARFLPVKAAFEAGFEANGELGAGVCVWHEGECVLDLWAGYQDRRQTRVWQADTLCCFFSVSKAIAATCVLRAVDQGLLQLDSPIASTWPEFGVAGKEQTTLRQVLAHQAGLPGLRDPLDREDLYNWDRMCRSLAEAQPWWAPGESHGYHARTFGFLLGEILRRATGIEIAQWLSREVTAPFNLEIYFGLPSELTERCADMVPARVTQATLAGFSDSTRAMMKDFSDKNTPTGAAFQNPSMGPGYMNSEEFRSAVIPALNGHGRCSDVARLMQGIPSLLSAELLEEATRTHSEGEDKVLKSVSRFGLGYMLHHAQTPVAWDGCFGHAGAGGSLAFCDPQQDLGFAFVMNQMQAGVVTGGATASACVAALKTCI